MIDSEKNSPDVLFVYPKLADAFLRDTAKALAALEAIYEKRDSLDEKDIRMYIINVHGMKSILVNVGEEELSNFASKLEQAGHNKNIELMLSETPLFLNALRDVIKKIRLNEDDNDTAVDEDKVYLREKLLIIKDACEEYNKKPAKDAMTELRKKSWSRSTKELLSIISEHLLHSDFDEAVSAAENILETMED